MNAARLAEQIKAKALVGMTSSGYTAFKLSSYRPDCKIYIFSDRMHMLSTLNLVWGVRCFYYDKFTILVYLIYLIFMIIKIGIFILFHQQVSVWLVILVKAFFNMAEFKQ